MCGHWVLKMKVLGEVEGERREHMRFDTEYEVRDGEAKIRGLVLSLKCVEILI
jgi:hypothetical protein